MADSKVTPDSGKVVIEKYADLRPLKRAQILSNYVTQYHKIFNADLKIEGRKKYGGSGDYTYVDENKKDQIIHIDEIKVDTSLQTIAKGMIKEEDQFFLSPAFSDFGPISYSNGYINLGAATPIFYLQSPLKDWDIFKTYSEEEASDFARRFFLVTCMVTLYLMAIFAYNPDDFDDYLQVLRDLIPEPEDNIDISTLNRCIRFMYAQLGTVLDTATLRKVKRNWL